LNEKAGNIEDKILCELNKTGNISGFVGDIERLELTTESKSFVDNMFKNKYLVKMVVDKPSYINPKDNILSLTWNKYFGKSK
jgi:DNA-binding MltR family transcriptional regulator